MTQMLDIEPDLLASLETASQAVANLIAGIRSDQLEQPTPCTEWQVRDIIDHVVTGNLRFAALVRGGPVSHHAGEPGSGDDRSLAAAFRASAEHLRSALAEPGALERVYQGPIGTMPGVAVIQLRTTELLLHGWDLAQATGQPAPFPPYLAQDALQSSRRQLAGLSRDDLPFAAPQSVADDAADIDKLAAFFGRSS
jgi:uncharacterized protein (TIGR03086 family)